METSEKRNIQRILSGQGRSSMEIPGVLMIPVYITKACPCNVYPLEPHFYIEKLGCAGVYLFVLFLLQNIDCGYSLEPPHRGGSNVYPQSFYVGTR